MPQAHRNILVDLANGRKEGPERNLIDFKFLISNAFLITLCKAIFVKRFYRP